MGHRSRRDGASRVNRPDTVVSHTAAPPVRLSAGWRRVSSEDGQLAKWARATRARNRARSVSAGRAAGRWRGGGSWRPGGGPREAGCGERAVPSARGTRGWRPAGQRWRTELTAGAHRKKKGARPTPAVAGNSISTWYGASRIVARCRRDLLNAGRRVVRVPPQQGALGQPPWSDRWTWEQPRTRRTGEASAPEIVPLPIASATTPARKFDLTSDYMKDRDSTPTRCRTCDDCDAAAIRCRVFVVKRWPQ